MGVVFPSEVQFDVSQGLRRHIVGKATSRCEWPKTISVSRKPGKNVEETVVAPKRESIVGTEWGFLPVQRDGRPCVDPHVVDSPLDVEMDVSTHFEASEWRADLGNGHASRGGVGEGFVKRTP